MNTHHLKRFLCAILLLLPATMIVAQVAQSNGFQVRVDSIVSATGTSTNTQFRELRGTVSTRDLTPSSTAGAKSGNKIQSGIRESGFVIRLPNTNTPTESRVESDFWLFE